MYLNCSDIAYYLNLYLKSRAMIIKKPLKVHILKMLHAKYDANVFSLVSRTM